jgi:hypothetical protein
MKVRHNDEWHQKFASNQALHFATNGHMQQHRRRILKWFESFHISGKTFDNLANCQSRVLNSSKNKHITGILVATGELRV